MKEFILKNEHETEALGANLANELKKGDIIGLTGDLGAGKTCLARGIAKGLGVKEHITSPTFTIIHEYHSGTLPLYHFDVYRMDGSDEMYELGYEEFFYGDGVCVVEWADIVDDLIPQGAILIHLEYDGHEGRICRIERK